MPRTPFKGWIFSETIKDALKYGYKIDIICAYKFNRGKKVFKSFVETLFEEKLNAKSSVDRNIAKLINYLYGRFGMIDIQNNLKIFLLKKQIKWLNLIISVC